MESGRFYNKTLTSVTGAGVTKSAAQTRNAAAPKIHDVSTTENPYYSGEDDSTKTLTGPGRGTHATSAGNLPQRWGHTAASGSRIEVDDTPGAETLYMTHHTGAGVVVEPDGAVHISSESRRGGGASAPYGDYYISAGGDIVIKGGGSVSIDTPGDLTLNVGGALTIKCGSYTLITKVSDETIDGSATRSVTNDQSAVVGGLNRLSVAGDMREQVTGNKIADVAGDHTFRIDGKYDNHVGGDAHHTVKGDHILDSTGKTSIRASSDINIHTGGGLDVASSDDASISAGADVNVKGNGNAHFGSAGDTKVTGSNTKVSGSATAEVAGGSSAKLSAPLATVVGPIITLATANLLAPTPAGTGSGSVSAADPLGGVSSPDGPDSAKEAETMEANDIVDALTSNRKFPEYIGNGVTESADTASFGTISHDTSPQAQQVYDEYSKGNQGSVNPSSVGEAYATIPDSPSARDPNITSETPDIQTPSRHDTGAKISRHFTLGQLTNAKHSHPIPQGQYAEVVKQHIMAAYNVLDPIKDKFPDILITSAFRTNSPNHKTGRAIDLVVSSRSLTRHAEIARFARDNLPVDQVFLERNTSGRTHVHVRVSAGGAKTTPTVLTCGDPKCRSRTPGIVVEYLKRRK